MTGAPASPRAAGDAQIVGQIAAMLRTVTQPVAPAGAIAAIATSLSGIADVLDVEDLRVAVDDPRFGRQVFSARRKVLGDDPAGLWGPPGVFTDPPRRLSTGTAELIVDAVGVAMAMTSPHTSTLVSAEPTAAAPAVPVAPDDCAPPAGAAKLATMLDGAVARALAHGWTFTLVALRFRAGAGVSAGQVAAALRAGDSVIAVGADEVAVVLPATDDRQAVAILNGAHERGGLPPCAFGLAQCPGDASTRAELLAHAARGLHDALAVRDHPARHD